MPMTDEESIKPRRRKRGTLGSIWGKIPTAWKMAGAIVSFVGLGASGYAYAERFATRADVEASDSDLRKEIRLLREGGAGQAAEIAVVRAEVAAVRANVAATGEDVRTLLGHILANPPSRRGR